MDLSKTYLETIPKDILNLTATYYNEPKIIVIKEDKYAIIINDKDFEYRFQFGLYKEDKDDFEKLIATHSGAIKFRQQNWGRPLIIGYNYFAAAKSGLFVFVDSDYKLKLDEDLENRLLKALGDILGVDVPTIPHPRVYDYKEPTVDVYKYLHRTITISTDLWKFNFDVAHAFFADLKGFLPAAKAKEAVYIVISKAGNKDIMLISNSDNLELRIDEDNIVLFKGNLRVRLIAALEASFI